MAFQNVKGKPRFYVDLVQFLKASNMIEREYVGYSLDGSTLAGNALDYGHFSSTEDVLPQNSFWGLQDLQRLKKPGNLDDHHSVVSFGIKWNEDNLVEIGGKELRLKRLIRCEKIQNYINYMGVLGHTLQPYQSASDYDDTFASTLGFFPRPIMQYYAPTQIEVENEESNSFTFDQISALYERYRYYYRNPEDDASWLNKIESICGNLKGGEYADTFLGAGYAGGDSWVPNDANSVTYNSHFVMPNRHSGSTLITNTLGIEANYPGGTTPDWEAEYNSLEGAGVEDDYGTGIDWNNNFGDVSGGYMYSRPYIGGIEFAFYNARNEGLGASDLSSLINPYQLGMCGLTVGRFFELISPNMNIEFSRDFSGVDTRQTTNTGKTIININNTGAPNWGDGNPPFSMNSGKAQSWVDNPQNQLNNEYLSQMWTTGSNNSQLSRAGRRSWRLKFDLVGNDRLMAAYEHINSYPYPHLGGGDHNANWLNDNIDEFIPEDGGAEGVHGLGTPVSDYSNPLMEDDNFYSQVLLKTMGGQLPFIFEPGHVDNATGGEGGTYLTNQNKQDQLAVCTFKRNSFKYRRKANTLYSITLDIEESW